MTKKVAIALGGTGGHIFPAIAFAEELKEKDPKIAIEFIGGKLATNVYFDRANYLYRDITCGKLTHNPFLLLFEIGKVCVGTIQTLKAFLKDKPDVVVGFGSYHSFPVLLAAKLLGIPLVLHESNSIPGRVMRLFSPYAAATGVFFPKARSLLKGNVLPVKMPIRQKSIKEISLHEARHYYHLNETGFTILVFGGSQGAKVINEVFYQAASHYLRKTFPELQVIHFAGRDEDCKTLSHQYQARGIKATVKPFEKNMAMAWRSADLVIARAGASSIAEQIEYNVPGVLIPFARATDSHQDANAEFMSNKHMSEILLEKNLNAETLALAILNAKNHLILMKQMIEDYKIASNVPKLRDVVIQLL